MIPDHPLSLEHATIAEDNGTVIGVLSGLPARQAGASNRILLRSAGWRSLRAGVIVLAGWRLFTAMNRHDLGDWYLQAIAVDPAGRGRGIGTTLLEAGFEQARTKGTARLTLDVDVENRRARALYERFGLKVVSTSKPARLLASAAVHRMSVDL